MRTFKGRFDPVPAGAVNAAEKRLGVELPTDYRTFLLTTNGLCPETDLSFTVPERGTVLLGSLYGICADRTHGDLEHEQEDATLWDPLPVGYVAIGHDPGGCLLLLTTLGDDSGSVYFWDRKGFWVRADGRNIFLVAKSFTEFMESLSESAR